MGSTLFSKRYKPKFGRRRKTRPKTFKTEEAAKKYASEKGMKEFTIEQLQEAKFRINN